MVRFFLEKGASPSSRGGDDVRGGGEENINISQI